MIKTRKQFEERLKKLREESSAYSSRAYRGGFVSAINRILEIIEDEGGCFKE